MSAVDIRRMLAGDLLAIEPQASQHFTLGVETRHAAAEQAEQLADQAEAWAVRSVDEDGAGRLIACFGILETFPGVQGVVWATLADGIGAAHLAMTRFARSRVRDCGLARVEAIVLASDAENIVADYPGLDAQQLIDVLMRFPTPDMVWARLCGLRPAHVLRKFGAAAETHMLFERIG
jgi:hypothetical protein